MVHLLETEFNEINKFELRGFLAIDSKIPQRAPFSRWNRKKVYLYLDYKHEILNT